MRLSIQNILIQTNKIRLRESKIEIFQRLRKPETLHEIRLIGMLVPDVVDDCVTELSAGVLLDAGEHAPGGVLQGFVTCYAVHNEDGFNSFGSVLFVRLDFDGVMEFVGLVVP